MLLRRIADGKLLSILIDGDIVGYAIEEHAIEFR
jgi:hypothetical protein